MELKELPWQEAVRTALILGTNVSMVLFIQITALERKRRPLLLISVLYGRCLLINLLGGILFQTYISRFRSGTSATNVLSRCRPGSCGSLYFIRLQGML